MERQFWTGDANFYREHLTDDSIMVFPEPGGTLAKDAVVQAIAASPRWADIRMENLRVMRLAEAVAVLTYKPEQAGRATIGRTRL